MSTIILTEVANAAALDLGVIDPGEGLTSTQIANALISADQMLSMWSLDQRMIISTTQMVAPLASGLSNYVPSDFTPSVIPLAVISAEVQLISGAAAAYAATGDPEWAVAAVTANTGGITRPLKILVASEYDAFPDKFTPVTAPKGLYYNRDQATPIIYLLPPVRIPGSSNGGNLILTVWFPMNVFADATTPYTLPNEGYAELIEYGLALRMSAQFPGTQIPEWVKVGYAAAERRVMTLNGQLLGAGGDQAATTQTPGGPPSGPPPPHA